MKTLRRLAIFVLMVMPPAFSSSRVFAAGETSIAGATEQILLLVGRSAVIHTVPDAAPSPERRSPTRVARAALIRELRAADPTVRKAAFEQLKRRRPSADAS